MLLVTHMPLHDSIPAQSCFEINADISAFSGQLIYPDSVWTIYKVNTGEWDTLAMTNTAGTQWTTCIPGQMENSVISYYIHAEDASNRSSNHPYIGAPDPHKFYVKVSPEPNLVVTPDTLFFLTLQDMTEGKITVARNYTNQAVTINQVNNSGGTPFGWEIENWNINLPYTMQAGDTLSMKVKLVIPITGKTELMCDTLIISTPSADNQVMICADPYLFSTIADPGISNGIKVFPNPMNQSATFSFTAKNAAIAEIEIYSMIGNLVSVPLNQKQVLGLQNIAWDGTGFNGEKLVPGIYLYRIKINNSITTGKISIIR
jgi:hypothetical protein